MQNLKPTLYSQWLTQQITLNYTIDSANGVKPILKIISYKFKVDVIIRYKKKVFEKAKKHNRAQFYR